ncbi:MAG: hypothetical protein ACLP8S_28110 [Solirubrobacteraceae bacterium]
MLWPTQRAETTFRGRLVEQTRWTLGRFVVVFAEWVDRYNTHRGHTALAGGAPLEVWRSDPTPVRALEHQQARWCAFGAQNQGGAEGRDPSQH